MHPHLICVWDACVCVCVYILIHIEFIFLSVSRLHCIEYHVFNVWIQNTYAHARAHAHAYKEIIFWLTFIFSFRSYESFISSLFYLTKHITFAICTLMSTCVRILHTICAKNFKYECFPKLNEKPNGFFFNQFIIIFWFYIFQVLCRNNGVCVFGAIRACTRIWLLFLFSTALSVLFILSTFAKCL